MIEMELNWDCSWRREGICILGIVHVRGLVGGSDLDNARWISEFHDLLLILGRKSRETPKGGASLLSLTSIGAGGASREVRGAEWAVLAWGIWLNMARAY